MFERAATENEIFIQGIVELEFNKDAASMYFELLKRSVEKLDRADKKLRFLRNNLAQLIEKE